IRPKPEVRVPFDIEQPLCAVCIPSRVFSFGCVALSPPAVTLAGMPVVLSPLGLVPKAVERGAGPVPSALTPGLSVTGRGVVTRFSCQAAGTRESQMLFLRDLESASGPL